MKLAALKGGERKLPVTFPGGDDGEDEVLNIIYRPGELTMGVGEELYATIDSGRLDKVAGILLDKILVGWDLEEDELDENGNPTGSVVPVPCTPEGLKRVPLPALGVIMSAISEDSRPNPPKDGTSEDGSAPEVTSEKSLSGIS